MKIKLFKYRIVKETVNDVSLYYPEKICILIPIWFRFVEQLFSTDKEPNTICFLNYSDAHTYINLKIITVKHK